MKNCGPTFTPTVDNSDLPCGECGEFDFQCIIVGKAYPYWGIQAGANLEEFFDKFLIDYKKKVKRISDLETALAAQLLINEDLTERIEALEA